MQQAPALRTLQSRTPAFTSSSAATPPNHFRAGDLIGLLDELKTLPSSNIANPSQAELALFKKYNADANVMRVLRKWINSPSIDASRSKSKLDDEGNENVELMVSGTYS